MHTTQWSDLKHKCTLASWTVNNWNHPIQTSVAKIEMQVYPQGRPTIGVITLNRELDDRAANTKSRFCYIHAAASVVNIFIFYHWLQDATTCPDTFWPDKGFSLTEKYSWNNLRHARDANVFRSVANDFFSQFSQRLL